MSELYLIVLTVLGIGFLVFIHEAGHYVCARLAGVRVRVFSLGFGPRLFGFRRGHTDYRVALVPLGGYVQVAGEDPTLREHLAPDDLHAKSVPARALFYLGGVAMNLLFAFIAFPIVFKAGVEFTAPVVGQVVAGSPAWHAGLRPDDRVAAVAGKPMYSYTNMVTEIALVGDREVELTVEREGRSFSRTVRPRYDPGPGVFEIGIDAQVQDDLVLALTDGSPAHAAGLRSGDQLVEFDGVPVDARTYADVERTTHYAPREIDVAVLRDGERITARFTPGVQQLEQPMIGVGPALREVVGIRPGLEALPGLDLQIGDHILQVDDRTFGGGDFEAFASGPPRLTMAVLRDGARRDLAADISSAERARLGEHIALGMDSTSTAITPLPGSPAEATGLLAGDEVLSIAGQPIGAWQDLVEAVRGAGAASLELRVRRGDEQQKLVLEPATTVTDLGFKAQVLPLRELYRQDSVAGALNSGMVCSVDLIKQLYVTLKRLFTGEVAAKNLGGIITISRVTYRFAEAGWAQLLWFLAVLSINLAVINLLPIPVLDGGHLMFVLIEGIKGSPVSNRVMNYSQILGLVFIVALLVFVTYNDILRWL